MAGRRPQRSDAELVRVAADDPTAFGILFERWFDRVHDVARNIVRNDDTAAEVAQDVFLTCWQRLDQLDDPERFGGWLLRTSRNRALNRLEKERRAKPLEGDVMTGLHDTQHGGDGDRDDLVGSNRTLETETIHGARYNQELVWAAAAALGERDLSLLDLHVRHQLAPAEIADELGVSANNAHQLLFRLRGKLGDAVANHQVWRDGAPRCAELAALVAGDPFDASINKIVQRHASRCATCGEERERVVDPAKLFAAVPIAAAPALLRDQAAAALSAQGVPVSTDTRQVDDDAEDSDDHSGEDPSGGSHDEGARSPAPSPATPPSTTPPSTTPPSTTDASTTARRRRIAFVTVVVALLLATVFVLADPAGNPELVAGDEEATDDGAADEADDEADLAPASSSSTTSAPTTTIPVTTTAPTTTATTQPVRASAPTTAPPTTAPPTTTGSTATTDPTTETTRETTDTTDPPPPPPAPVIERFTLRTPAAVIFCPNSTDLSREAVWATANTDTAELTTANGTTSHGASGSHIFCAPAGSTVTLTATGPGGSATDSRTMS